MVGGDKLLTGRSEADTAAACPNELVGAECPPSVKESE